MKSPDKKETDNLDFEIKFYEQILKNRPDFIQVLIALGEAYTKKGSYREGLKVDKKLAKLKPHDPAVFYNLACSYSLLTMNKLAFDTLNKAIELGYNDFSHLLKDADLENLRNDKLYAELINRLVNPGTLK